MWSACATWGKGPLRVHVPCLQFNAHVSVEPLRGRCTAARAIASRFARGAAPSSRSTLSTSPSATARRTCTRWGAGCGARGAVGGARRRRGRERPSAAAPGPAPAAEPPRARLPRRATFPAPARRARSWTGWACRPPRLWPRWVRGTAATAGPAAAAGTWCRQLASEAPTAAEERPGPRRCRAQPRAPSSPRCPGGAQGGGAQL